jgi:c-di-GMP-binding flagellar brake protein YcgR
MIDSIKFLKIRGSIQIMEQIDDEITSLTTTIIDIDSDNNIFNVYNPIYKNRIYTISREKKYEFRYVDEKTGIYSFEGKVLKRYKENSLYILEIEFLGNIKKIQRREFFRINIIKNLIIKEPIDDEFRNSLKMIELKDKIKFSTVTYSLKDISGGGLGFYSKDKFKLGTILIANLNLGLNNLEILGEIVRVIDISDSETKYLIGVRYLHLSPQKRSIIINFIFEKQRQLRQKGLI